MPYVLAMRTRLAINDDVLDAAKAIARQERRSVGEVVSALARRALQRLPSGAERNGLPLLSPRGAGLVTLGLVNALRDAAP